MSSSMGRSILFTLTLKTIGFPPPTVVNSVYPSRDVSNLAEHTSEVRKSHGVHALTLLNQHAHSCVTVWVKFQTLSGNIQTCWCALLAS